MRIHEDTDKTKIWKPYLFLSHTLGEIRVQTAMEIHAYKPQKMLLVFSHCHLHHRNADVLGQHSSFSYDLTYPLS